jgi:hypothetical protein
MARRHWSRTLITLIATVALSASVPASAKTATVETYGDYSQLFARSAGQYAAGTSTYQWAWSPQSSTESHIYWGIPSAWPPAYRERFILDGDWVTLAGWWDNGTYYTVTTSTEWQANVDCRTGRTFLPTGGAQHYARWLIPSTGYCMYTEGTVTEQLSGKTIRFIHQQLWSLPAACPVNTPPVRDVNNIPIRLSTCVTQWESWSDDNGAPLGLRLERSTVLAKGIGMAYQIRQTYPTVWSANATYAWKW